MRGAPDVLAVPPGIGAGLDRREVIAALIVGCATPGAAEVGVKRRGPAVGAVSVAAGGVGLPDLDERISQRLTLGVEYPAADGDALADRLTIVLAREVGVAIADGPIWEQLRARDLSDGVRQMDERVLGMTKRGRPVGRGVERRMGIGGVALVAPRRIRERLVASHPGRDLS